MFILTLLLYSFSRRPSSDDIWNNATSSDGGWSINNPKALPDFELDLAKEDIFFINDEFSLSRTIMELSVRKSFQLF